MEALSHAAFYPLDLLIGLGGPAVLLALRQRGRLSDRAWRAFLIGALLGAIGEIPCFLFSVYGTHPVIVWVRPLPEPFWVFLIAHTLTDGLIFLAGAWIVEHLCAPPTFARFRWAELAVLLAWGQVSSLAVELSSVLSRGWMYVEGYAWNPTLFHVAGRPIALAPQGAWLVLPVVFYWIVVSRGSLPRPSEA